MHNLQLTEDQDLIVDTVRKFVADSVAPAALDLDEHRHFAGEAFRGLGELGVYGLLVAEANGGAGMGYLPFVAALEAVGQASGSLAQLWIGQAMAAAVLEAAGRDELAAVAGAESLAVFVGPEHGLQWQGGSLHGAAELVPGGGEAALAVVAAHDGPQVVLVLASLGGVGKTPLRSLGLASTAPVRLQFAGAKAVELLRGDAAATALARAQLTGWIGTAAAAAGQAKATIEAGRKHAGERIAFGKPLLAQEAVARKLVESLRAVEAARQLTWHAARLADLGQDAVDAALQARIGAVEALVAAADESIQIHGGFGYTVEYHVERHYRDGKTFEVLGGGNESLRARLAARQFACR